jgi:hypothetical protein
MTAKHPHPDPFEILRAELIEALARMVRRGHRQLVQLRSRNTRSLG